jgi:hypothetical protein
MTDMPDNLAELDARIGADMADAAKRAAEDAETYRAEREAHYRELRGTSQPPCYACSIQRAY